MCTCLALAEAQEGPASKGAVEISIWAGGGTGLGHGSSFQFANSGLRFGKVLTTQHGPGFLRGNFEYAADLVPLYLVLQDQPILRPTGASGTQRQTVYGGAITPVVLKWNFTRGARVVPFAAIEETAIFTTSNVPAGDTSTVNFGSALALGLQLVRGTHHAFTFSGHLMHISNASIGNHNPGINIALQFRLGYQWWK